MVRPKHEHNCLKRRKTSRDAARRGGSQKVNKNYDITEGWKNFVGILAVNSKF
jgi:hypothetical protein